ncbi:MAG: hypothetical protein RL318_1457 [Fibrobacterota bacterium]|jgi:branched-chain amino acid transport system ATP-binding protein
MTPLLEVSPITKRFGGLVALQGASLRMDVPSIHAVIGPNGAGKTTFFNCLTGIYTPDGGSVRLAGQDLSNLPTHEVCRAGLARTFQNIRLFPEMTVLENVLSGRFAHLHTGLFEAIFRTRSYRDKESRARALARDLLESVGLSRHEKQWARNLPYGLQRRLEIARALATSPKVILLDEPGAGMNPQEIEELIALIGKIRDQGIGIVLIEHHMKLVMDLAESILVLDHGEPIAAGTGIEIRNDPRVIEAYLGKGA